MSYFNGQTGYRKALLTSRADVRKFNFVVLDPDGLVKNVVPGYENCDVTILGSPAMGATFVDYLVTAHKDAKNTGIGGDGIESFLYVIDGELTVKNADEEVDLTSGGYFYSTADKPMTFVNKSGKDTKAYVYKRRYEPLEGYSAHTVTGNINKVEYMDYEGMTNCQSKDFLPAANDLGFDMNMHILRFAPGASHGYIEHHVQQHGMLFLQGKGMYYLDNEWMPLEKGDYVFMDSYVPQACYAVGDEDYIYIYSKDCNRDIQL
ncbi:MAG: (S)-ureidoglycine aminohydrolase [Lachnospiraceae bacterium]|nr:(S)-ureidoglycine aminohydrolase [Lachnospiraceae bacterium]